jgi:hypothetical protein
VAHAAAGGEATRRAAGGSWRGRPRGNSREAACERRRLHRGAPLAHA